MTKSVLVLPGAGQQAVRSMFISRGFTSCSDLEDADIVCFTGGEDVNPAVYGEHTHPTTVFNENRDDREADIFYHCVNQGVPMIGICRGGQFLNVLNGGKLYQNVNNHAIFDTHEAFVYDSVEPVQVTSTHHQMMRANHDTDFKVLLISKLATKKSTMSFLASVPVEFTTYVNVESGKSEDLESLYYPGSRSLCFQPHPENNNCVDTTDVFFKFVNEFIIN